MLAIDPRPIDPQAPAAPPSGALERRRYTVRGLVQGVGFRPFVHRLATRLNLAGQVRNDAHGVCIEVEGRATSLDAFALDPVVITCHHQLFDNKERGLHEDLYIACFFLQDGKIREWNGAGGAVLACSALKERYRARLREGGKSASVRAQSATTASRSTPAAANVMATVTPVRSLPTVQCTRTG
mgnify:CR=1 FL=1